MKVIEYIGEVLPDGHLSIPDEVRKELDLSPHCNVKIIINVETSHVLNEASHEITASPREINGCSKSSSTAIISRGEQSGQKGWEVFRRLGKDAIGGKLSNASTNHDKYLYGKEK
jgi:bifunctional DNA-binding transcriptional regulator/antitoxin component of YhaV-PrlF toxin-antitoxin module